MGIKAWLGIEDKKQLEWLKEQAEKFRPSKYMVEIPRRVDYVNGEMKKDGEKILQREFPLSYGDMIYKMIDFNLTQLIVSKRARCFQGRGSRFYLKDRSDKEVDPESPVAKSFEAMIKGAMLRTTLDQADAIEDQACAVGLFCWWDLDHLEISPYTGDKCHIAVNPDRSWDPYSAYGVAFEQEGYGGLDDQPKYVVYAARDKDQADERDESGRRIFHPSLHYISTKDGGVPANDGDVNPYRNRLNGRPLYPFTWMRSRKGEVYHKGSDQLVRFNRLLNLIMTYLVHNTIWQMAATPTFELPPGGISPESLKTLKKIIFSAPNKALELPPGVKMHFVRPDVEIAPFTGLIEMLTQYEALMNKLSPRSIDIKGGLPQSGIALQIEMHGLVRHIENRQELLRQHVLDLVNRVMISIWNTRVPFAPGKHKMIPDGFMAEWDAGQIDIGPQDTDAIIDRHVKGFDYGTYSVDDLAMAVHQVDRSAARKLVDENLARNAEVLRKGTRYPEQPQAADNANNTIDNLIAGDNQGDAGNG